MVILPTLISAVTQCNYSCSCLQKNTRRPRFVKKSHYRFRFRSLSFPVCNWRDCCRAIVRNVSRQIRQDEKSVMRALCSQSALRRPTSCGPLADNVLSAQNFPLEQLSRNESPKTYFNRELVGQNAVNFFPIFSYLSDFPAIIDL